jgi:hypothetical protein
MGNRFPKPSKWAPTGTYEAQELRKLMRDAYKDKCELLLHEDELRYRLQKFLQARKIEADEKGTIAGFKHPSLCMCLDRVIQAWEGDLKVIVCDRPVGELFNAWSSLNWAPAQGQRLQTIIERHIKTRESFLKDLPGDRLLRLSKADIVAQPAATVSEIIGFLGLEPDGRQRSDAIRIVRARVMEGMVKR